MIASGLAQQMCAGSMHNNRPSPIGAAKADVTAPPAAAHSFPRHALMCLLDLDHVAGLEGDAAALHGVRVL